MASRRRLIHGMTKSNGYRHPAYHSWNAMKTRCHNPACPKYANHGGRGITVCERWKASFAAFWQDMGPTWSQGLQIERTNNGGNYEPSNCRWATRIEQGRNKRNNRLIDTPAGTMTAVEAEECSGINRVTIVQRVERGVPVARLFDPPTPNGRGMKNLGGDCTK